MAKSGSITENDVVELEAMRTDNFSWHPCHVTLCSTGLGLVLQFGDNNVEEMITDKEGALARIRVRSSPLQGDDCSFLQQGDHVLATRNTHVKDVFYDACLEEVIHVRHSKRTNCRCSFRVKWLHQALEGEVSTVQASAIMKLAQHSINLHPTISTFFNVLESSNAFDKLPSSTTVDSMMDWEMDMNRLLQKQIEEISNSADASQKKVSKNLLLGLKVDLTGQNRSSAPLKEEFTGTENKEPTEIKHAHLLASVPSIKEEFTGIRSPLNPLAARAALASLRSIHPQPAELSCQSNVKKGVDEFPLEVSATLGDMSPKFESIVKTLFTTSSASEIEDVSNVSSQKKEMGKKTKTLAKKITQPSERRLTRAQIQRSNGVSESTQVSNGKEIQLESSSKTRRVTRSSTNGADKFESKESNGASERTTPSKFVILASPINGGTSMCSAENGKSLLGRDVLINEVDPHKMTFTKDTKICNFPRRQTRSGVRAETDVDLFEGQVSPESNRLELEIPIISPTVTKIAEQVTEERKTRSTSSHVKATANTPETVVGSSKVIKRTSPNSKMQERRFSPRLRNVLSESNRLELEGPIISPIATTISEQVTEEGGEKRATSSHVKATPESVVESGKGVKRNSANSKTQERRFSPRLRYLTETNSENKA